MLFKLETVNLIYQFAEGSSSIKIMYEKKIFLVRYKMFIWQLVLVDEIE